MHPVPNRQGIYLLNSQSLSALGGHRCNGLGLGLSLPPFPSPSLFSTPRSIFQPAVLACATSSRGFGPLTGKLWGIRRARAEKDEGERGRSQTGALQGSNLAPPHCEGSGSGGGGGGLNGHTWMSTGVKYQAWSSSRGSKLLRYSRAAVTAFGPRVVFFFCLTFIVIHKSCQPFFRLVPHCAVIDWGRQPVIHEHHRGSIQFSLSAFNGRLFYSLIKWDSTPLPHSHLSLSLHDNQLMHVQTPPGSTTYNIPVHKKKVWGGGGSFKC